jgi:hypothetical protein
LNKENLITLSFPEDTAKLMKLPVSPSGQYSFASWLELGVALTVASGDEQFSNFKELERQMTSQHWGEITAGILVNCQKNWRSLTAETGLTEFILEEKITRADGVSWFTWFFYHFYYPKYDLMKQQRVTDADIEGFARVLSPGLIQWMAFEPITEPDGVFTPLNPSKAETAHCLFTQAAQSYARSLEKPNSTVPATEKLTHSINF